jgi:periplasmic protein TonB
MFDLSAEKLDRPFRRQARGARSISVALHVVVSSLVIGVPLITATDVLPEVQAMKVFISAPPAPPPPPPPPPPPRADKPRPKPAETPTNRFAAPIEAPLALVVEPSDYASHGEGEFEGVEGGVEGGVAGGVLGGVIGGLVSMAPPPPPPPALPPPKQPVRIGGQINSPAIVKRVEPKYPDIAAAAKLSGLVILEALVNESGAVESIKTLRSPSVFLEKAAVEALKEWRYSPLVLDGVPMSFILTVTFNFSVQ